MLLRVMTLHMYNPSHLCLMYFIEGFSMVSDGAVISGLAKRDNKSGQQYLHIQTSKY